MQWNTQSFHVFASYVFKRTWKIEMGWCKILCGTASARQSWGKCGFHDRAPAPLLTPLTPPHKVLCATNVLIIAENMISAYYVICLIHPEFSGESWTFWIFLSLGNYGKQMGRHRDQRGHRNITSYNFQIMTSGGIYIPAISNIQKYTTNPKIDNLI